MTNRELTNKMKKAKFYKTNHYGMKELVTLGYALKWGCDEYDQIGFDVLEEIRFRFVNEIKNTVPAFYYFTKRQKELMHS